MWKVECGTAKKRLKEVQSENQKLVEALRKEIRQLKKSCDDLRRESATSTARNTRNANDSRAQSTSDSISNAGSENFSDVGQGSKSKKKKGNKKKQEGGAQEQTQLRQQEQQRQPAPPPLPPPPPQQQQQQQQQQKKKNGKDVGLPGFHVLNKKEPRKAQMMVAGGKSIWSPSSSSVISSSWGAIGKTTAPSAVPSLAPESQPRQKQKKASQQQANSGGAERVDAPWGIDNSVEGAPRKAGAAQTRAEQVESERHETRLSVTNKLRDAVMAQDKVQLRAAIIEAERIGMSEEANFGKRKLTAFK